MRARLLMAVAALLPAVTSLGPVGGTTREVSAADPAVTIRQGVLYWHDARFSGTVTEGSSGSARSRTQYRNGMRDGRAEAWYADGRLAFERQYRNGREEGEHRGWWPDGRPHFVYNYRDGLIEGTAREWFPDGKLYREFHYAAGQESGSERMWYADGRLRANYVVREGRRFGLPGTKGCDGVASRESRVARTGV